ncbi:MAG: regulatory protein RecX [Proteobacteria bacterium]|nr:regulatory protein RecX [Pseudomonadota bacterium]
MRRLGVDPEDARAARVAALDMLARRDLPAAQVIERLERRGYAPATAAAVAAVLVTENLVNERRYVEHFVAYHAGRGQGPIRVRAELRQDGVDPILIDEFIDAYAEWEARAREARQKKFGPHVCDDYTEKARQSRFLAYRGFTGAQIRSALDFDPDDHET